MSVVKIEAQEKSHECDVYISASGGLVGEIILYTVLPLSDGDLWLGAYYGSVGGGEFDGGFFRLDIEQSLSEHLDYEDVDALEDEDATQFSVLDALMQKLWTLVDDNDGESDLYITDHGKTIYSPDDEGVWMSEMFDGDSLDEISEQWKIGLRFES